MWGKVLAGAAFSGVLMLTACGGDSSSRKGAGSEGDETVAPSDKAYFVDNVVIGLRYRCGEAAGFKLTGDQGVLFCTPGETVSFYVGDILLGSASMQAGTSFVTPLTLATEEGVVDQNVVINLARLLISLDSDQNPDNGIQIDPASHVNTGLSLDFTVATESFTASAATVLTALSQSVVDGPFDLVSAGDADSHLVFGLYLVNAGYYEGLINRSGESTSEMAFMASRYGAVYGVNINADGMYTSVGFDMGFESYNPYGNESNYFKIDADSFTGATLMLDAQFGDGVVTGAGVDEYPNFTAERQINFEPVYDQSLVDDFKALMPVAIDLKGNQDYFVFDEDGFVGMQFGAWEGSAPNAADISRHSEYWFITFTDVVSAKDGVLKLLGMSINGYLVELTANFNGQQPVITTEWRHIFEGIEGSTSTYQAYFEDYFEEPFPEPEAPAALSAEVKTVGEKSKASQYWAE